MIPEDLRYTEAHEWVREAADGVVRVGHHRLRAGAARRRRLVELPRSGTRSRPATPCGEVESTKSVSEIYAAGRRRGRRASTRRWRTSPELVNPEPYGDGWMFELAPGGSRRRLDALLDAAAYAA